MRLLGGLFALGSLIAAGTSLAMPSVPLPPPQSAVTPSGAPALEIPIPVPPGAGSFQPDLRLRYSSQAGDGPFGIGWSLNLSEIRRTTRFGMPLFDDATNAFEFELDGQLLVREQGSGANTARFHPFSDDFQRVLRQPSTGAIASWEVTSPTGVKALYGTSTPSKVFSSNGVAVRWLLSELVDPHGNRICFTYEQVDHTPYPKAVTYTHTGTCSSGLGSTKEVEFLYDTQQRPDPTSGYFAGAFWELKRRVTSIEVSDGIELRRRIAFTYSARGDYTTHRSRLKAVRLYGCRGGTCDSQPADLLPEATYGWTDPADFPGSGSGTFWSAGSPALPGAVEEPKDTSGSRDLGWRTGDLDANGIPELVRAYLDENDTPILQVYRNSDTQFVLDPTWTGYLQNLQFETHRFQVIHNGVNLQSVSFPSYQTNMLFAEHRDPLVPIGTGSGYKTFQAPINARLLDVNGDRRADFVASFHPGIAKLNCPSPCTQFPADPSAQQTAVVFLNTGTGWVQDTTLSQPFDDGTAVGLPPFESLFIREEPGGGIDFPDDAECILGGGGSPCTARIVLFPAGTHLADVTGDGRIDVLQSRCNTCVPGGAELPEGGFIQGDGGFYKDPSFMSPVKHIASIPAINLNYVDQGVRYVDINGDGLADLLKSDVEDLGGGAWDLEDVWLSKGAGNGALSSAWCSGASCNSGRFKPPTPFVRYANGIESKHVFFADLNGDGLVDITRAASGELQTWFQNPHRPQDPDCTGACGTVWDPAPVRFDPPFELESVVEVNFSERNRKKGALLADFDGNGTLDFLKNWGGSTRSEYAADLFSDRIETASSGEGGLLTFHYVSLVVQRDSSANGLEAGALLHASTVGEFPFVPIGADGRDRFWPTAPVVDSARLETTGGPAQPTQELSYRYAGSMWDRELRQPYGNRIFEITRPDGVEQRFVYQSHGRTGRLSYGILELPDGSGREVHQTWDLLTGGDAQSAGSWDGASVGRLAEETLQNYYPGSAQGALQKAKYKYSGYGSCSGEFNFACGVEVERPSGNSTTIRTPLHLSGGSDPWILGLVTSEVIREGIGASGSIRRDIANEYYTSTGAGAALGKLKKRSAAAAPPLFGGATTADREWTYDLHGNPATYKDALGRTTTFCYDGGSLPASFGACPSPIGGTHSLLAVSSTPVVTPF